MRLYVAIAVALLGSPAFAQQPADKTYTLTVTAAEAGIIGQALGEIPFKIANPVLNKLGQQVRDQDAKVSEQGSGSKPSGPSGK